MNNRWTNNEFLFNFLRPFFKFFYKFEIFRAKKFSYPTIFLSHKALIQEHINNIENIYPELQTINDQLLNHAIQKYDSTRRSFRNWTLLQFFFSYFLFGRFFGFEVSDSFAGFQIPVFDGSMELLLFIIASLGVYLTILSGRMNLLDIQVRSISGKLYQPDLDTTLDNIYFDQHVPLIFIPSNVPEYKAKSVVYLLSIFSSLTLLIFIITFGISYSALLIYVSYNILINSDLNLYFYAPTLSVLIIYIIGIIITILSRVSLPYTDYSNLQRIFIAESIDRPNLETVRKGVYKKETEIYEKYLKRGYDFD